MQISSVLFCDQISLILVVLVVQRFGIGGGAIK